MTPLIKEYAREAGFQYDPSDCNFYGEEGWINEYIVKLSKRIADHCLESIDQSQGDLDFAVWKIKKDFGL